MQCSVAADFQRRLQAVEVQELPHKATHILLLAEECGRLLHAHFELFLPVLSPYLSNSSQVVALRMHQVFGEQLLPWLGTGEPPSSTLRARDADFTLRMSPKNN